MLWWPIYAILNGVQLRWLNKVNRCVARYSPRATTTNRPTTGHWISLHGLAQIDQKCQFWAEFGRFWAKILFLLENQKFCYPHNGNPPRHLVHIVFWSKHWTKCAKNGNIWPKMTKNADFGPNLAIFGPKSLIFMGVSKSFGTNITENHLDNFVRIVFLVRQ